MYYSLSNVKLMPMEFPHEVIDYDGIVLELNMRLIIPMKTSVSVIMTHIM